MPVIILFKNWSQKRKRAIGEICAAISVFNLRWDDLRSDTRFDKIVAAAKAASQ